MAEWIAEYKYKRFDEMTEVINDIYRFTCSSCGWSTGQQGISFQFCPHCGEPMKNANNPNVVPISTLEDIKAEIEDAKLSQTRIALGCNDRHERIVHLKMESAFNLALEIIDKHINKEGK